MFKALCLFFLSNFPGPMLIPCPTSIRDSRVANLDLLVLRKTGTCHKLTPGSRLATIDTTARVYASS